MAATRLIALHVNKGKTVAQCLKDRTDYAQNPEKTQKGELVTGFQCDPMTADEEFLLSKRQYQHITGKYQKNNVIAYQIRQSFKPGEITAEEANQVGRELAERFTKGKHAFIVATHTDRAHIHNHIIFNSTSLDSSSKFKNFYFSGLAVQRLSDIVCMEHGLSIIEKKPYAMRTKNTVRENRVSHRDVLRQTIDSILKNPPQDFSAFLSCLEENGYAVKQGKFISVRGKGQERFIRLCSLGEGYTEDDINAVLAGTKAHRARKGKRIDLDNQKFRLLVEIDDRIRARGPGYQRWATTYNLKQMAKTRIFLKEQEIDPTDLDLPVAFDIEEEAVFQTGRRNVTAVTTTFCDEIKKAGFEPMVYSGASALRNYFEYSKIREYKIWVAHYTKASAPAIPFSYDMWQYTSRAVINGANTGMGYCDLNYYLVDKNYKE